MRVAREEVFGPAAAVIVANDEMETVRLANDSQYGLGASIWTEDLDKAEKLSREIRSGIVTVNNVVIFESKGAIWWSEEEWIWKRIIKIWNAGVCQCQVNQVL